MLIVASVAAAIAQVIAAVDPCGSNAELTGRADEMVFVPAGEVAIGEAGSGRPGATTHVPAFRIDRTEVTNRAFAAFVASTGHVTEAEREDGSAVFVQPQDLKRGIEDPGQWWRWVRGASWRHPEGPDSNLEGRWLEPVVHVTFADAMAYARWRGGTLPTEAQWERAARADQGTLRNRSSPRHDTAGKPAANAWQGLFPLLNTHADGFAGRAAVGSFPPNGFGLYDMIGNVWEWTRDGNRPAALRGGSYLCSDDYCANARPAGRQVQEAGLATSHAGFRVVSDDSTHPGKALGKSSICGA